MRGKGVFPVITVHQYFGVWVVLTKTNCNKVIGNSQVKGIGFLNNKLAFSIFTKQPICYEVLNLMSSEITIHKILN